MIREERPQKILEYIESGKREGAKLVAGGGVPKSQPKDGGLEEVAPADSSR